MPSGTFHLKELDSDKITLDGTLSVSGASTFKGDAIFSSNLVVSGDTALADTTASNVGVHGTLSVSGQITMGSHLIPDTNAVYDIGSAEKKIRHLYVSDNSLWVGDTAKITNVGGKLKFRKRKTDVVPAAVLQAGRDANHANDQTTLQSALAHAGVASVHEMKLFHWHRYMNDVLNVAADIADIFRDADEDYEDTAASDAWKEINDTKIYTANYVGIGTSDPDDNLHVRGSFKVESDTGFQLIRSTVGANDPLLIIDTKQFGVDETIEDLTGQDCTKFTKLYRVYGTNSEGYGRDWYWGLANDDYTNISLAVGGESGGDDPDLAFTFTTASEFYCNKVYAALVGNADTASKLLTARNINGIPFDGSADITVGVDGITSSNGNIGINTIDPLSRLSVESTDGNHIRLNYNSVYYNIIERDSDGKLNFQGKNGPDVALTNYMTMSSTGYLGLGTQDPQHKLHVVGDIGRNWGTGRFIMNFDNNYRQGLHFSTSDRTLSMFSTGANGDGGTITFNTRAASGSGDTDYGYERMRINPDGNVGIGVTSPSEKLEVADNIGIARSANNLNYGCSLRFKLLNSANERVEYARIVGSIADNTDGSEDGFLSFAVKTAGTLDNSYGQEKMRINSDGEVSMQTLSFGSRGGQHLYLYGANYGMGIQNSTAYLRTGGNVKIYRGGVHHGDEGNAGGGVVMATFDRDGWNRMYQNVLVTRPDDETSEVRIHGSGNGTGRLYVGQADNYGGGIEYNGDSVPATSGAGADHLAIYRHRNGTSYWTMRQQNGTNDWTFRGKVICVGIASTGSVNVTAADNTTAEVNIHGSSQGTGRLYVGQETLHGGGIEYNGDNSPVTAGAGADYVTLYRRASGTNAWTARNYYNSNNWEFRGQVDAAYFGKLQRATPSGGGYMVGSYNINTNMSSRTNPIYTIGTNYMPSDTSLGDMYGIGHSHSNFSSIFTGTREGTGWGMYVASAGVARIGLNGNNGVIKMMCKEDGDSYAFEPGNDGWLRLMGAASGQGNVYGSYTSMAIGNLYSAGASRFSDDRLKHFEEPIQNSLDLITSLNPFKYKRTKIAYTEDWTGDIGEEGNDWDWEMGLIAQEVLKNPNLNFAVVDESKGPENLYGLDYNHFISLLIQGVKDLKQIVDNKEVEIENLKKELNDEKLRINDVISRIELLERK